MKTGGTSTMKKSLFSLYSVCTVFEIHSKTGCTSTMKNATFFIVLGLHCFWYRLKWGVFNQYCLSETYKITKGFHMKWTWIFGNDIGVVEVFGMHFLKK